MKHGPHQKARDFVARRVRQLRERNGWTQEVLSVRAGLHRAYVGVIEREEKGVGIDVLGMICDALNVTLQEFFSGRVRGNKAR